MPKAYSLDLRERVARFVGSGRWRHAAAAHFKVSVSFVVNLMKAYRMTGSLEPKPGGGGDTLSSIRIGRFCWPASPRGTISPCRSWRPNSLPPRAQGLISRWATATASKRTLLASEQDRPDVRQAREEWTATRQPRMRLEPHRLVFLDETGLCRDPARADPRKGRCRHHGQLVSPQKPAEDADKFFALLDVFFSIEASPSTIALISTSAILEFIFMTRTLSRSSSTSLIVGERSFKAMRPLALQASISGALFVKWGNHKGAASVQCNELIFARTGTHTDLFR